jgi:16S rRNA (guanine966-N2)-methyltransferase
MRIVGGRMRGLTLAEVGAGDREGHLRPTSDRVREAIFNLLTNGPRGDLVAGRRVLDLFAGTGALALEALSRGAAEAVLIDSGRAAGALIAQNIARAKAQEIARHLSRDATSPGACNGPPFDLVFLDPPYAQGLGETAAAAALAGGWIARGATVVWEEARPPLPPPGLALRDQRRYGDTLVTICEAT